MTHAIKKFTLPVLTILGQPNIDVALSVLPIMIPTTTLPLQFSVSLQSYLGETPAFISHCTGNYLAIFISYMEKFYLSQVALL